MMKNLYKHISLLPLLLFVACKSPLDKEFDREKAEADFTRIVKVKALDSAEAKVMAHFMVEHDLIGAQVLEIGSTYRDILTEAQIYWDKTHGTAVTENSQVLDSSKLEELNGLIDLHLQATENVTQSPWSHSLEYNTSLSNLSDKTIKAIKGKIEFYDVFGEKQHEVDFRYLDPLAPSQKIDDKISFRFKNEITTEKVVQYKTTNPFTVVWVPLSVVFEDGSKVE